MLVLTRKRSECIKVGEDIVIKVIHTSKGTVKLGIEAPSHVRVLRAELADDPNCRLGCPIVDGLLVDHDEDEDEEPLTAERFLAAFAEAVPA